MKNDFAPWAIKGRPKALTVRSADGVLTITLQRGPEGVFVERAIQRPRRARVIQASVFDCALSFRRWCDADFARFEYPLVTQALRRHADELFGERTPNDVTG